MDWPFFPSQRRFYQMKWAFFKFIWLDAGPFGLQFFISHMLHSIFLPCSVTRGLDHFPCAQSHEPFTRLFHFL
jgi:hypothetical protein